MRWIAAKVMCVLGLVVPAAAARGAEDYQSFILTLDSPPDRTFAGPGLLAGGFVKGEARIDKTLVRGGRMHPWYAFVHFRQGGLTLDGKALKGQLTSYDSLNRIGTWGLEGAVDGGKAAGTYTVKFLAPESREQKSYSGKFTGTITAGSELAKSNAIAAGKDWPCWSGPYTNMTSVPSGAKLVDDLADARLVWRSQQALSLPQGNFSHPYYAQLFHMPTCGGGAAPIVADGKVFATQWFPDGKEYQADGLKKLQDALEKLGVKEPTPAMKLHVSKTCHDWYVCLDAATGGTLWIAEFPDETGSYFESEMAAPDHKNGPVGNTPCYADGKLFGLGMSGYLRAMDAKTGKLLWKQKIAGTKPIGRGNSNCVTFIGGVVMTGNHEGTLYACDPDTGAVLWKATISAISDPQRWVHDDKESAVVLASTYPKAEYRCLEPRTGRQLWSFSGNAYAHTLGLRGDRVVLLEGKDTVDNPVIKWQGLVISAYRLTPEKAEKIWEAPSTAPTEGRSAIVVLGEYVAAIGNSRGRLLDVATGKEVATAEVHGPANYGHVQVAEDRLFVRPDGAHGAIAVSMLGTTPETFKVMGRAAWGPSIPHTSSYAHKQHTMPIVDGRMYFRGADGIYCYDLRKTGAMLTVERAVGESGPGQTAAADALVRLCKHADPAVRERAALELAWRAAGGQWGDRKARVLSVLGEFAGRDDQRTARAVSRAMAAMGAAALPLLLRHAASHAARVRQGAMLAAGQMGGLDDPRVDEVLQAGLADAEPAVVRAALGAAAARGASSRALESAVVALVDSEDQTTAKLAAESLLLILPAGQLPAKRPRSFDAALVEHLGAWENQKVAHNAVSMVRALGDGEALRIFVRVLKTSDALRCLRACQGLGGMGAAGKPAIPAIKEAKVRWAASRSFSRGADAALKALESAQ